MNIYIIILAMIIIAIAAYFIGTKRDKNAFQFLTEDNGNFSLIRLIVLVSNLAFLFVMIYIAIKEGTIFQPSWPLVAYMVFINLSKVLQKFIESNPEKINEILQTLRK